MLLGEDSLKIKKNNSYYGETLLKLKLGNHQLLRRDSTKFKSVKPTYDKGETLPKLRLGKLSFPKQKLCQNFLKIGCLKQEFYQN